MNKIKKENLTISSVLFEFINNEIIPDTGINIDEFWKKFDAAIHELAPINKALIEKREVIQKKIDFMQESLITLHLKMMKLGI